MNRVLEVLAQLLQRSILHRLIREARPASPFWNVFKSLVTMAIWWTVFFGAIPFFIVAGENFSELNHWRLNSLWQMFIGWPLFSLCGALGIWSSMTMAICGHGTLLPIDCASQLVVAGPYRWVRNPMGVSAIWQGASVALLHGSVFVFAYVMCGLLILETVIRPWEERDLEKRFGVEYVKYKDNARCWTPRRTPYSNISHDDCGESIL